MDSILCHYCAGAGEADAETPYRFPTIERMLAVSLLDSC